MKEVNGMVFIYDDSTFESTVVDTVEISDLKMLGLDELSKKKKDDSLKEINKQIE
jgi:hypothetical protein